MWRHGFCTCSSFIPVRLYTVVMDSRYPDKRNGTQLEIVSIHEPLLFNEKILIDVSNRSCEESYLNDSSNAEILQTAIPTAYVVKAFNTISSFAMQSTTPGESRNVFVASDHSTAKNKVITLACEINFDSFSAGSIRAARHLERNTKSLFS
ncbi:unnamed protein product [Rotaria sp. Silwood1]|nr:unnamed protein product [Rotaria sp. Silwood1]